jgi:predicted membrane-bound spermidine synthase
VKAETKPRESHSSQRGDLEDILELKQLLAAPHRILYRGASKYQKIVVIESKNIQMYLNRQLQFNSMDERMYHEAIVHPAMILSPRRGKVLCVGSNDGQTESRQYNNTNFDDHRNPSPIL